MRTFLRFILLCGMLATGWAHALQLSATRLWPSSDYTRLTLEAPQPLSYKYFTLGSPDRLVIDLEGVEPGATLDALSGLLAADDPYIASIRTGLNRPGVMRIVLALKTPAKPSVFALQPLGQYGHRLVIDLYPATASVADVAKAEPATRADKTASRPRRSTPGSSRWRSTLATGAKIPARSAPTARTRRTSPWRWRKNSSRRSTRRKTCAPC